MGIQPVIFGKRGRVVRPQLADGGVEKRPPRRAAFPDQMQVLGTKDDGIEKAGELRRVFQPDAGQIKTPSRSCDKVRKRRYFPFP
jgi:hypothetical protein